MESHEPEPRPTGLSWRNKDLWLLAHGNGHMWVGGPCYLPCIGGPAFNQATPVGRCRGAVPQIIRLGARGALNDLTSLAKLHAFVGEYLDTVKLAYLNPL